MDTLELLLHPVRVRIVHALSGGQIRTTAELCDRLPDVSKATMYRQVTLLVDGGVLEVAAEERVHGAIERHYRLHRSRAVIDSEAAASMSLDDHRQGFAAALGALVAEFNTYLDREGADPYLDLVGYRQMALWLTRAELEEVIAKMTKLVVSKRANGPGGDRRPYLVSPILFPLGDA